MEIEFCGSIINVLDFLHPHAKSLIEEGLWGFPDNRVNRNRWGSLKKGCTILIYGNYNHNKGVYLRGTLIEKFERHEPVEYWTLNKTGYPLQIRIKVEGRLEEAIPVLKEELANEGVKLCKVPYDRWSLIVFGNFAGATYSSDVFERVLGLYDARNRKIKLKADHDTIKELIYKIGLLQGKISQKEVQIDNYKLDVAWRRIPRADPYIVFEVHIHGNLEEALTKLKHARDMWNSKPILVTRADIVKKALEVASGAFHEIYDELKIVPIDEIIDLYKKKEEYKYAESRLGIS
jgi:hypothetical protein